MSKTYLVSACLLGLCTRYDGRHNRDDGVLRFCGTHHVIPVCPEQLGGLPTPRPATEIKGGDGGAVLEGAAAVKDQDGNDLTDCFIRGAEQALLLARLGRAAGAVLKSGSPSCGLGRIRDGTFEGGYRKGDGVTAALLKRHRIPVFSERSLPSPDRA